MPITLVYETHSTTLDNEAGIATGWLPGELSEEGLRQAVALGQRRRDDGIDLVVTSDLARAVDTTRVALGDSRIPIRQDSRLRECNYGDLNGSPVEQLRPRAAYISSPFPLGESYEGVVQRTADLLEELAATVRDGSRVLLVSHWRIAGRWPSSWTGWLWRRRLMRRSCRARAGSTPCRLAGQDESQTDTIG